MITNRQVVVAAAIVAIVLVGFLVALYKEWITLPTLADLNRYNPITLRRIKLAIVTAAAIATPIGVLYVSYRLTGPLDTILYATVFVLAFGLLPGYVALLGKAAPMNVGIGKFNQILGNFAAGHPWLVQVGGTYELCIGEEDRYWLDGEWYEVEEGLQNRTHLGWRPLGVTWHKSPESLAEYRVDVSAVSDGGTHDVERAGIDEVPPPSSSGGAVRCPTCEVTYHDASLVHCPECNNVVIDADVEPDSWLIDLKRLYQTGLQRLGNMDLIETSEEQTMRDEMGESFTSEWSAVIGGVAGLLIGATFGYLFLVGI